MFEKLKDSVESAEMETTLYTEVDKEDQTLETILQQPPKSTRWDKAQDAKEKENANKKQAKLSVNEKGANGIDKRRKII